MVRHELEFAIKLIPRSHLMVKRTGFINNYDFSPSLIVTTVTQFQAASVACNSWGYNFTKRELQCGNLHVALTMLFTSKLRNRVQNNGYRNDYQLTTVLM